MKKFNQLKAFFLVFLTSIALSGCEIVGDILQAGIWIGIIIVVVIVAIVVWIWRKIVK